MFDWVVKNFGPLKHVPVLPHVFDAFLKMISLFQHKHLLDYVDDIETEVCSWQNTSVSVHKYGGIQFNTYNRELGHIHGNGLLDVLFSREQKLMLMKQYPVQDHHVFKNSGWISFKIKTIEDKQIALELLKYAYDLKPCPSPHGRG
ncbi:MAG: DUF5519 family protein [Cyclobacteriaceae bacterium]|nr:DUF5519 family protein [Cyclobacteriaceae bacterium]